MPICEVKSEAWSCAEKLANKARPEYGKSFKIRPCSVSQYSGSIQYSETLSIKGEYSKSFTYTFLPPKTVIVNEEYLIYDFVGALGSFGGTLGMFIGFSFVGLTSYVLYQLEIIVQSFRRKIGISDDMTNCVLIMTKKEHENIKQTDPNLDREDLAMKIKLLEDKIKSLVKE